MSETPGRDAWFQEKGFSVLRVTNAQVYAEFEGVLETIRLRAEERLTPSPTLPPLTRERETDTRFIALRQGIKGVL